MEVEELNPETRQVQVSKNHYQFQRYSFSGRWVSYFHQIALVEALSPQSVLEVGVGDQVFADYLRSNTNITYKSLDIADDLAPDYVGSVDAIPLSDESFDIVCAFQVLEHLPFDLFAKSLREMSRVTKKHVIISLPHYGPPLKINFKIPLFPELKLLFRLPHHPDHRFNGQHYWEIGKKNFEIKKIKSEIENIFTIEKELVPFENPYHHFFVLRKNT